MKHLTGGEHYFIAFEENKNKYIFGIECFSGAQLPRKQIGNKLQLSIDEYEVTTYDDSSIVVKNYLTITVDYSGDNRDNIDFFLNQYVSGINSFIHNEDKLAYIIDLLRKVFASKYFDKTGLVGELLYIIKTGMNSIKYWHNQREDVFDFIDKGSVIEVKTTASSTRSHTLKYPQLLKLINDSRKGIIVSIIIKSNNPDTSLNDIIQVIRNNCDHETLQIFDDKISLYNELIDNDKFFNLEEALDSILIFDSNALKNVINPTNIVHTDSLQFRVDFNLINSKFLLSELQTSFENNSNIKKVDLTEARHTDQFDRKSKVLWVDSSGNVYKVKRSKYYTKNKYFWYAIVESDFKKLMDDISFNFIFILDGIGYARPSRDQLINYLNNAPTTNEKSGKVKHRHLYLRSVSGKIKFCDNSGEFFTQIYSL